MRMPQPERREMGENVIPLINIVFLLLIFFMLTGTLAAPDPIEIDPPEARQDLRAAEEPEQGLLLLSAAGDVAFEGDATHMEALPEMIRARLEENENLRLTLKADAGVQASRLLDVMDVLRDAGAERILLLTQPEEG